MLAVRESTGRRSSNWWRLGGRVKACSTCCGSSTRPKAVDALIERIAAFEPDRAEVRVVLETPHGLLVERLLDAGYVVVPVNPDLVARRREPEQKKDDAEDQRL